VFFGRAPLSEDGAPPAGSLEEAGDSLVPGLIGAAESEAAALLEAGRAKPQRHLFACGIDGRSVYARVPLSSFPGRGKSGDGVLAPRPGDVLLVDGEALAGEMSEAASGPAGGQVATGIVRHGGRQANGGASGLPQLSVMSGGSTIAAPELEWLLGDDPFGPAGDRAPGLLLRCVGELS
jgi:hypothetical protein